MKPMPDVLFQIMKMHRFRIGMVVLFLCAVLGSAPSLFAQEILIFSTSHSNTGPSVVEERSGVLKVEVSTFTPIQKFTINGASQPTTDRTRAKVYYPFNLKRGENSFKVFVKTEAAEETKSFVLEWVTKDEDEEKKSEKPWSVIAMASVTSTSNAENVAEDEKSGLKIGLIAVPKFKMRAAGQNFEFMGVLLREKFLDPELADEELEYTLISAGWLNKAGFGDWRLDVGWSDSGNEFTGLTYDTAVETAIFVGAQFKLKALDRKRVILEGKYSLIDQPEEITSDYDGDGGLLSVGAKWNRKNNDLFWNLLGGLEMKDAKGMYQDYNMTYLGAEATYALSKITTLGGKFGFKSYSYKENDPLKGDKESSSLMTITVNGSYTLKNLGGLMLAGDVTQKQKSSNIESLKYTTLLITVSGIYIF